MSWFADLAGKAENLLNNLDEQTGEALRHHNVTRKRFENQGTEIGVNHASTETAWLPKKKALSRSPKKVMPIPDMPKAYSPTRKASPLTMRNHQPRAQVKDNQDSSRHSSLKKSPSKRSSPPRQFNVEHCPKTLVRDVKLTNLDADSNFYVDQFTHSLKLRRHSLPSDLELQSSEEFTYKMQNMEVENAMLKNELNVMNREVTELLERLRKTEDGNDVDSSEITDIRMKQNTSEVMNRHLTLEKQSLTSQVEILTMKIQEQKNAEVAKYKDINQRLEVETSILRNRNLEMEEKYKQLQESTKDKEAIQTKLENDLRHAQSTVNDLQANLQKTTEECRRLERDWEAYKLRVKNMLQAKDSEILKLQEGVHVSDDTQALMEEMEHLKEERDELQDTVATVRSECADMKVYVQQAEARHNAAERVVAALRDALRDEHAARNRADASCVAVAKEMKAVQMETAQTIASLRTALRDKEYELNQLRDMSSTVPTSDSSTLNVADYDTIDNNKVHYLTQTLVQRQTKIDNLLAENNMLRIQLEKLESKLKSELTTQREKVLTRNSHSVVHLQENESRRTRGYNTSTSLSALSLRLGVMVKRYPLLRMFVIGYMVCLHFWVITVLFTSTPEDYVPSSKS
ncbi:hypothetical protein PYW08_008641 [Mythimna loreyi]|uniref:Uncharacterized protein n=1 Tax=Mythimna loreyi TaxID=667449 RepID=A0ACC2QAU7_9NEOP|nr:hypothetical protein PYW08_008641 [Mythimna loreyi]